MSAAMLLSWLAVSALMSALIAGAALVAHQLIGRAMPTRIIWAVALLASAAVTATQPLRRAERATPVRLEGLPLSNAPETVSGRAAPSLWGTLRGTPDRVVRALATNAQTIGRKLPAGVSRALLLAWPLTSAGIGLLLLVSYRRQRALLRHAERHEVVGAAVHVVDNSGPVVIGVVEPAIVVPAWLLERSEEEQRLVVAHEAAHIAAHDPQLLLAGCALVALMPWNVAAWVMLSRLRLAIELDCDARVLARGTNTRRYGQLLIELSAAMPRPRVPLAATAFSYRASHLERRLRTMTARPTRFLAARRASALLIGSAAVLAACGAELPTSAELRGLDVAKAESRIGKVVRLDSANTIYIVNGRQVASATARSIAADSIITIDVRKADEKHNEIRIVTRGQAPERVPGDERVITLAGKKAPVMVLEPQPFKRPGVDPLFLIDGKKSAKADMDKLSPNAIESVSVLKGPAAVAKYGQEAANGVVEIVLKK